MNRPAPLAGTTRAISITIVFGVLAVLLSIALVVGWTLLILRNVALESDGGQLGWLLYAGTGSLVVIAVVTGLLATFLVREILEVRRQNTFIDSVTHELKSPLAALKLCLETLERRKLAPDREAELHAMMRADVDRLSVFIDDILQASRLAHGRAPTHWDDVFVREAVERCRDTVARRHEVSGERFTIEVPDDLHLFTDPAAFETMLKNLLDNAIKYSEAGTPVRVSARRGRRDRVLIEVTDDGIGIDRRQLKRVFERFYRVSDEAVRTRRGTGLGLFVVQALARKLGGDVEARSEGLGQGATMRLHLPTGERLRSRVERALEAARAAGGR